LQEALKDDFKAQNLAKFDSAQNFISKWSAPRGRSGGILVGIKKETFEIHEHVVGDHYVRILLTDKTINFKWNSIVVYGAAQADKKVAFLTELSSVCHSSKFPLMVAGDFSIVRNSTEKNKAVGYSRWSFLFNAILCFFEVASIFIIP
jgi:hypothetical protein